MLYKNSSELLKISQDLLSNPTLLQDKILMYLLTVLLDIYTNDILYTLVSFIGDDFDSKFIKVIRKFDETVRDYELSEIEKSLFEFVVSEFYKTKITNKQRKSVISWLYKDLSLDELATDSQKKVVNSLLPEYVLFAMLYVLDDYDKDKIYDDLRSVILNSVS